MFRVLQNSRNLLIQHTDVPGKPVVFRQGPGDLWFDGLKAESDWPASPIELAGYSELLKWLEKQFLAYGARTTSNAADQVAVIANASRQATDVLERVHLCVEQYTPGD